MSKDLVKKQETGLSTIDFGEDAGAGFENFDENTSLVSYLKLLHSNAKEINSGSVPGAEEGMYLDTGTKELYRGPLRVIPCGFMRVFKEWHPDGYPVKTHTALKVEVEKIFGEKTEQGFYMNGKNQVHDHREHFVLFESKNGAWTKAILSLAKTAIKQSQAWMSRVKGIRVRAGGRLITPATFSHIYTLNVIQGHNNKGHTWPLPSFDMEGQIQDRDVYDAARDFNAEFLSGTLKTVKEEVPF